MGSNRHTRRVLASACALLLGGTLGLAACGSDESSSGKVTIRFWDNNGGPDRTPLYEKLIADFERQNDDIDVEYLGVPIADVQQKYDTAVATGDVPDVGGVTTSYLANLVGQDALEPLDDRLAGSDLNGKLLDGFVRTVRDTVADGKLYQIPSTGNLDVIWYRKDLYQRAGLTPPTSWGEFFTTVDKLTDRSANKYGYTIRGGAGSIFQLLTEMYAYSGISEFFDSQGRSTVNDPRNVELIEKIAALYNEDTPEADVNNGFPEMVAQFGSGAVAMMHHNLGSYSDHVEAHGRENVGSFALPVGPSGRRTIVPNPVDGFAVFKGSENKDAAWRFVQFLVSKQSNSYWNEQVGQIPANVDARGDAWLAEQEPVKMALEVLDDPNTTVVPAPMYLPQFSSITKADTEPLYQKVLLGDMSAQDFADTLAQKLTDAQKEWDERD